MIYLNISNVNAPRALALKRASAIPHQCSAFAFRYGIALILGSTRLARPETERYRIVLASLNRQVRSNVRSNVICAGSNQAVIGSLLHNMSRPPREPRHHKDRREDLSWNPHVVVGRGMKEVRVREQGFAIP